MNELEQLAALISKTLSSRTPRDTEQSIACQQAFVNAQQMLFWMNAFDQMRQASAPASPIIHAAG